MCKANYRRRLRRDLEEEEKSEKPLFTSETQTNTVQLNSFVKELFMFYSQLS